MAQAAALTAATLAATLSASVPAAAQSVPQTLGPDRTLLEIVAVGRSTRVPDLAIIRAGVSREAPTAGAAMADVAQRMARIVAALRAAGVADRDLATARITLEPQYRYADNQPPVVTGYRAANLVTVRFRDLARTGAVLDALVAAGANQIEGPTLALANPQGAEDEARADAIRLARARAALYAGAAGLNVERIVAISETGGFTPPPMPMMARSFAAKESTPLLPGETEVTATVTVRFALR